MSDVTMMDRDEQRVSRPGIQIRKAQRKKAKLRLALMGPTGSGKTMSALRLAFGIGGKVGVIDTENGSADLYADAGDYDVITLTKPYDPAKYKDAIAAFEDEGYNVIIVDSLSHAWAGAGGLLDKQGQAEKKTGNSFTAWREITPQHNSLVEALLTSPAHIIATMRVRTEYVMEEVTNRAGKKVMQPRKVGLQPVQRDGLEYEFTVVMDVDAEHRASASKDRTRLFDGWNDIVTERTGSKLRDWLEAGVETQSMIDRAPTTEEPKYSTPGDTWIGKAERKIVDAGTTPRQMHVVSFVMEKAANQDAIEAIKALPIVKKLAETPDNLTRIRQYEADARKRLGQEEPPKDQKPPHLNGQFDVYDIDGHHIQGPFTHPIEFAETFCKFMGTVPVEDWTATLKVNEVDLAKAKKDAVAAKTLAKLESRE